ncbi:hypothetical protein P3W55_13830 [Pseudomonas citronellolis]|uniref:Uncharacterized protein n=1 Tax=Pseudomonas citronellolis TaxID=53408 RepID=A0AAW6P6I5_9PSED|nr:hypothetical protein [Pseudomonas citronellolis]MDF3842792.1 hypothetical protein [Pseudomonas citronellolis]
MHDISPKTQIACLRADIEEICRERSKAEAEAQALREEVAALRARVVVVPERKALPELMMATWHETKGWNACLDELARLNGKVVSEGLLRDLLKSAQKLSDRASNFMVSGVEFIEIGDNNSAVMELEVTLEALRAVLDDGKEVLDANPADA